MKKARLLLVEDDKSLGETLKERLQKEGYSMVWVDNLKSARIEVEKHNPDLILLDVRLPDGSGFDLAEELSKKPNHPPFLFLTAQAGAPERLKGFELGAEEFIPKPFHLKELLIRVNHVLDAHRHVHSALLEKQIQFEGYTIDFEKFRIISPTGMETLLAAKDSKLLQLLISENHKTISRSEILDTLWGEENFPTNRTIDNAIVRIRQALGEKGQEAIRSVRGIGYQWTGEIKNGK